MRADRPWHFFRRNGAMPEAVELRLTIPPELGPEAEVREELRQRVAAAEASIAAERARTGQRVYGRRAVLRQSWQDHPKSIEPRRNLRPQVAARSKWSRIEALQRNQAFQGGLRDRARQLVARYDGQLPKRHLLAETLCQRKDRPRRIASHPPPRAWS